MYKKVSNIADRQSIEKELGVPFKYPKLYNSSLVVNGIQESTLSVVTLDNPTTISYAIWGLLPLNYKDEWVDFQNAYETLTIPKENLITNNIFKEPFLNRRCLIVLTGFFTSYFYNGTVYPYYVYLPSEKPFCVAGIYNTLEDGFITCSMILKESMGMIKDIQNLDSKMPLTIPQRFRDTWLDSSADIGEINNLLDKSNELDFKAHPIAKEFFKNEISFDSMLEPVSYKNIPSI
ncbi:SOS response-associated peptidase [Aquimarina addita]|uniref:Abasic site processing protein n=1 Tax=Aquimarina addita TaxID=870485 RepID=A0ABP7X850_9FLAO